jgi:hypothetical protein
MPEDEVVNLTAKDLIARHEEWKLTLWAAAFTRQALTVDQIEAIVYPDCCAIGRWLLSDASGKLWESDEFKELKQLHGEFHGEMMEIAKLLTSRDFPGAVKAIKEGSSFAEVGRKLARGIAAVNKLERILAPS